MNIFLDGLNIVPFRWGENRLVYIYIHVLPSLTILPFPEMIKKAPMAQLVSTLVQCNDPRVSPTLWP